MKRIAVCQLQYVADVFGEEEAAADGSGHGADTGNRGPLLGGETYPVKRLHDQPWCAAAAKGLLTHSE